MSEDNNTEPKLTPFQASILEARNNFDASLAVATWIREMTPEAEHWGVWLDCSGLKLTQAHPGPSLGRKTLASQTSAMAILRALGVKDVNARGDGAIEANLNDGRRLILHDAVAAYHISLT